MKTLFAAGFIVFGLASARGSVIGDFTQQAGNSNPFSFTNNGGVSDTFSGVNVPVFFKFATPLLFGGDFVNAVLNISGTSTAAGTTVGNHIEEVGFAGTFSIIHQTLGTNLLSGTFSSGATGSGQNLGKEASFADATPPSGEVTYTSAYLDLSATTNRAFSLSLSGLSNPLTLAAGGKIDSTTGNAVGTFSAEPVTIILETPEPMTFGLIGGALVGLALLRRGRKTS